MHDRPSSVTTLGSYTHSNTLPPSLRTCPEHNYRVAVEPIASPVVQALDIGGKDPDALAQATTCSSRRAFFFSSFDDGAFEIVLPWPTLRAVVWHILA